MKESWIDSLITIARGVFIVLLIGYLLLAMIGADPNGWAFALGAIIFCFLLTQFDGQTNAKAKPRKL